MVSSSLFVLLLLCSLPSHARRNVSVSSQEWVIPIDELCDTLSVGVNNFMLEGASVDRDGSVISEVQNITMVHEIVDCAKKYNTSTSLILWTDEYPFNECSLTTFDFFTFENQIQPYITQYNVEENVSNIIRHNLVTKSGEPVRASIGFAVEPEDSPLWNYIKLSKIEDYFDVISVHFGHPGPTDESVINDTVARKTVDYLINLGIPPQKLELSVETLGFMERTNQPLSYNELIEKGAPPYSDGHFDGYIYQSQKQVVEKTRIIEEKTLYGFSLQTILYDLPAKDNSSLFHAAFYYS